MNVYIQHLKTQRYLRSNGEWTASPAQALEFYSALKAVEFWQKRKLSNVQFVVISGKEMRQFIIES